MRTTPVLALILALTTPAYAVPTAFSHQGRILDSSGVPLTGAHTLTISVHDSTSATADLWSETKTLEFDNGYFSTILGETQALDPDDFDGSVLYVGIAVDGGPQLPGRLPLQSVPYAFRAQSADTAKNVSGGIVDAEEIRINGTTVIDASGVSATVSWNDLVDVPADFSDGSDDGFVPPTCGTDEILKYSGSAWVCAPHSDHEHTADQITDGTLSIDRLPMGTSGTTAAFGDHSHPATGIDALSCSDGEVAQYNGTSSAWECTKPATGGGGALLVRFEFNESGGTSFADSSGGGNGAKAEGGGLAAGSAGHSGKAINFSGGLVSVASGNTIADSPYVTAEAWIQPDVPLTGIQTVFTKEGAYTLVQKGANVEFAVTAANGTCAVTSSASVTGGEWSHVQGSYDGNTISVRVGGVVAEAECAKGPLSSTLGGAFHIGAAGDGSAPYDGGIDEVRAWAAPAGGGVRVGSNSAPCAASLEGSLRWDATAGLQACTEQFDQSDNSSFAWVAAKSRPVIWSGGCKSHHQSTSWGTYCLDGTDFNSADDYLDVNVNGTVTAKVSGFYKINWWAIQHGCSAKRVNLVVNGTSRAYIHNDDTDGNYWQEHMLDQTWPLKKGDNFYIEALVNGCNAYAWHSWNPNGNHSRLQIEYVGPL